MDFLCDILAVPREFLFGEPDYSCDGNRLACGNGKAPDMHKSTLIEAQRQ